MSFYVHQNVELFQMAAEHFRIGFWSIDKIDRRTRTVHLRNGDVLTMPEHWNLT
jgi:hypothetical protein